MNARAAAVDPLRRLGSTAFLLPFIVFLLMLAGRIWGLGDPPLAYSEGVRSLTAHQMVESGRWATPMLYGRVYLRKPPLYYWTLATAETITGRADEWTWRMPSLLLSAMLGAFITFTSRRWFGPTAAVIAAGAYLSLFALLPETTRAEIDAANTAASMLCAIAILELFLGFGRSARWAILAGLALGASLLIKGPAGITIIIGAMLGPPIVSMGRRLLARRSGDVLGPHQWSHARRLRPWPWMICVVLIGAAMVAAWILVMIADAKERGLTLTLEGFHEGVHHASPLKSDGRLQSLILPGTLVLAALPASIGLFLACCPSVYRGLSPGRRQRLFSLVGVFAVAMLACVASAMTNPRYGYVCLPLLAIVAGGAAEGAARGTPSPRVSQLIRLTLAFTAAGLAAAPAAVAILTAIRWETSLSLILIAIVAATIGVALAWRKPRWSSAVSLMAAAALLISTALALRIYFDYGTADRSGQRVADELRAAVTRDEPDAVPPIIHAHLLIFSHPEVLHYAKLPGRWVDPPGGFLSTLERECWVIFTIAEWELLPAPQRARITRVKHLKWSNRHAVVGWFDPKK